MQTDAQGTRSGSCPFAGTTLDPTRGPAASEMAWLVTYADVDEGLEAIDRYLWFIDKLSAGVNIEWASRDHREIIREGLEVRLEFEQELFGPSWERRRRLVAAYRAGEIGNDALPVDLLTTV